MIRVVYGGGLFWAYWYRRGLPMRVSMLSFTKSTGRGLRLFGRSGIRVGLVRYGLRLGFWGC